MLRGLYEKIHLWADVGEVRVREMSSSVQEQEARHNRTSCTAACHVSREHHAGPQLPRPRHKALSAPASARVRMKKLNRVG